MQVSEIMHKGVTIAQINDSIQHVANIMKKEDIGIMPVYKNERAVGMVTDRDIVISCLANGKGPEQPVSMAMTREIISVYDYDHISTAQKLMVDNQVSRLLVLDKGETPVGMLSLHDLARNSENSMMKAKILNEVKR